jgi:transcriptional regulator with XRE-family HTH domain
MLLDCDLKVGACSQVVILNGSYAMSQKGSRAISISIEQIRAARALLGWSQSKLAESAGMSLPTIKRVEAEKGPRVSEEARVRLRSSLEAAGVEFIDENGGGPGVRLRKRQRSKIQK